MEAMAGIAVIVSAALLVPCLLCVISCVAQWWEECMHSRRVCCWYL
jgi:hypothetical protein